MFLGPIVDYCTVASTWWQLPVMIFQNFFLWQYSATCKTGSWLWLRPVHLGMHSSIHPPIHRRTDSCIHSASTDHPSTHISMTLPVHLPKSIHPLTCPPSIYPPICPPSIHPLTCLSKIHPSSNYLSPFLSAPAPFQISL